MSRCILSDPDTCSIIKYSELPFHGGMGIITNVGGGRRYLKKTAFPDAESIIMPLLNSTSKYINTG